MTRLVIAFLLTLTLTSAARACDGYDLIITQLSGFNYNAADPVASELALEIRAAETGLSRQCRRNNVEIEIVGGTASDPALLSAGRRLEVEWEAADLLSRQGDTWRMRNNASNQLVDGETLNIPLYRLLAGQFIPPGDYEQTLRFTVGDLVMSVPITVTVVPALRFEGASTGGTETLDLGDITSGSRASSDFFFRTNSAVAVTLTSDNLGMLVHEQGEAFGRIAYAATLSGQNVDLSNAAGETVELPFRGTSIQTNTLEVEVPPTPNQYAGRYRDVITLSFIAY